MFFLRVLAPSVFLICTAYGQARGELGGFVGGAKTYDDEGLLGNGVTAGFTAGYRFRPSLSAEFEYARFEYRRTIAEGFRWSGGGNWFTANFLKHWGVGSRTEPYLVGSVGGLNEDNAHTLGAWGVGFGVKGYVTRRFYLRPEVKILVGTFGTRQGASEPPVSNIRFTLGAGWRF